MGNKVLILVCV